MARHAPDLSAMMSEPEREGERFDERDEDWTPPQFTAAPPARDGMEQRWVRVRLQGADDVSNLMKRQQQGWTPRQVETLPKSHSFLTTRFGDLGSVVGNQDSVLMERPVTLGDRYRAYDRKKTRRLESAIGQFVDEHLPRQHGTKGGAVVEMNVTQSVGGRNRIADD